MSLLDRGTFEERFQETRSGWHWRVSRNVRCAIFLTVFAWRNATLGRRVRVKYRAQRKSGEPYWLD